MPPEQRAVVRGARHAVQPREQLGVPIVRDAGRCYVYVGPACAAAIGPRGVASGGGGGEHHRRGGAHGSYEIFMIECLGTRVWAAFGICMQAGGCRLSRTLSNLQRDPNDPSSYVRAPTSSTRVMTDHRQLIYLFLKRNPHSALRKRRLRPRDACLTIVTLSLSLVLRRRTKLRACISRPRLRLVAKASLIMLLLRNTEPGVKAF